jgi:hypothetical protein
MPLPSLHASPAWPPGAAPPGSKRRRRRPLAARTGSWGHPQGFRDDLPGRFPPRYDPCAAGTQPNLTPAPPHRLGAGPAPGQPGALSAAVWGASPAAAATELPAPDRLRPAAQAARATASRCLGRRARCCRDGSRRAFSLVSPGPSHWDRKARRAGVEGGPIMFVRSARCAARLPPGPRRRGWPDAGRRAAAVVEVRPPGLPPWHDW